MTLIVLSSALAGLTSWWTARRLAAEPHRRFWIFAISFAAQPALVAELLSPWSALTRTGWIVCQLLLTAAWLAALSRTSAASAEERRLGSPSRKGVPGPSPTSGLEASLAAAIVLMLALSLIRTLATPVHGDAANYHASRAAYWMQHRNLFPFETHNDRQTVFGIQSELQLLWGFLLARQEVAGKVLHWLAVPGATAGVYSLARTLACGRTASLGLALLFLSAPLVRGQAAILKPEAWVALFCLATVFWLVEASRERRRLGMPILLSGASLAFAISAKFLAVALIPVVLLGAVLAALERGRTRAVITVLVGLGIGGMASGLFLVLVENQVRHGHPFGPAGLRGVVRADGGPRVIPVHVARFLIQSTLDPPALPTPAARRAVERFGSSLARGTGASVPLAGEQEGAWPGTFTFTASTLARRYSTGGVLLAWSVLGAPVWLVVRTGRRRQLPAPRLLLPTLACGILGLAILFGIRWMAHSAVPERFLIPAFALALPAAGAFVPSSRRRFRTGVGIVACFATAMPAVYDESVRRDGAAPLSRDAEETFTRAIDFLEPASKVVLVASQDASDYPLFGADGGFGRTVVPWGQQEFEPARLRRLVVETQATHLLIEDDQTVSFHWNGKIATDEMARWAESEPDLVEQPLGEPPMRLFAVLNARSTRPWARRPSDATARIPDRRPLIFVDEGLEGRVVLRSRWLYAPWAVEQQHRGENGFLWLGSSSDAPLLFRFWSNEDRELVLRLEVVSGPSRRGAMRKLSIRSGSELHLLEVGASPVVTVRLRATAGVNSVEIASTEEAEIPVPGADTRHLMVGIHRVVLQLVEPDRAGLESPT